MEFAKIMVTDGSSDDFYKLQYVKKKENKMIECH